MKGRILALLVLFCGVSNAHAVAFASLTKIRDNMIDHPTVTVDDGYLESEIAFDEVPISEALVPIGYRERDLEQATIGLSL